MRQLQQTKKREEKWKVRQSKCQSNNKIKRRKNSWKTPEKKPKTSCKNHNNNKKRKEWKSVENKDKKNVIKHQLSTLNWSLTVRGCRKLRRRREREGEGEARHSCLACESEIYITISHINRYILTTKWAPIAPRRNYRVRIPSVIYTVRWSNVNVLAALASGRKAWQKVR